jgi:hypothetical protein
MRVYSPGGDLNIDMNSGSVNGGKNRLVDLISTFPSRLLLLLGL